MLSNLWLLRVVRLDNGQIMASHLQSLALLLIAAWFGACSLAPPPRTPTVVVEMPADYGTGAIPDSAGGLPPDSATGLPPDSAGGLPPDSATGLPPDSAGGLPPDTAGALPPDSATGLLPDSVQGYDLPEGVGREEWWKTFDDPPLDRLIETALSANLDLQQAVARLEELRHRHRIARAPLFPSVTLDANATRSSTPANTGLGSAFGGDSPGDSGPGTGLGIAFPDRFDFTTYTASLGFAYELDFWGRLRNESGAAVRDFLASGADAATVQLTVIASTISTYLEVAAVRAQLAIAMDDVDLLRDRAELTEQRYRSGLATSFELYSIRQRYRTAQANLPGARTAVADAEGRLALILGRYAGGIDDMLPPEMAPAVSTEPVLASLPVALLEERPDVMAAFERLEAARLRVGARQAELLPTITLNGTLGLQSSRPANLFRVDQWFMNLVGGLVTPIFQGGRLRANAGAARAVYDQAAITYVRTVLDAYRDVRTSLVRFDNERERHARVLEQVADARASLDSQLRRYRRGVADYVEYLDARINLNGAETARVLAERAVGEARLAVHRALGGAWVGAETEEAAKRLAAEESG